MLRLAFVFCNFTPADLRLAGRRTGAGTTERASISMSHGWNYKSIKEEQGGCNDK
jgi:hypothetical protein